MARTRSRSPKKAKDERTYPVRLRVLSRGEGFGSMYDEMHAWLNARVGKDHWAWHSDNLLGMDCSSIFLDDPRVAVEFLDKFDLDLAHWTMPV